MRWLTFLVGGLVVLTLQSAVAPRVELLGARPDWLLVVVVFFAMHARMPDAAVGAWIIGAGADLMTLERPGLMATSYLLAALLVFPIREYFFRYRSATQFVVTFIVCVLVRGGWCLYYRMLYEPIAPILIDLTSGCLLTSIYTAVWAPPLHKILLPMSRLLGITRPRYTFAGLERMRELRV